MLDLEEWMDIKSLHHKDGYNIKQIARLTGYARNTVRKVLRNRHPEGPVRRARGSKLDPYKGYIAERCREVALSSAVILREIRPMGYAGSVATVRRHLRVLRQARRDREGLTVRFETPPGRQAQADWGSMGQFPDSRGRMVKIYFFTLVLGFSRMLYVRFTCSMATETLIDCHRLAFAHCGGWPDEILYDNMAQVRLADGRWNPLFLDFLSHHGITPRTHRPRRARTKGKVERMVGYVKDSFLNGRSFVDLDDLNAQCLHWLGHVANLRVHATTGRRPCDLLGQERLHGLDEAAPYLLARRESRRVSREGRVHFRGSRYSVPPEHVGRTVVVEQDGLRVRVRLGDAIVAEHAAAERPGLDVCAPEHIAELWKLSLLRPEAPRRRWTVTFRPEVEVRPLDVYEREAVR